MRALVTDPRLIEAALARTGWEAGAEALVAGWVEHRQDELEWEETWEPDDRCRYLSERPTGEQFVIEWVTGDTWELAIEWPGGWGREHVRMGWLEDLQDVASEIHDAEGPFGGPKVPICAHCSCEPSLPACELPNRRGQRLAGDVELRFELLRKDLAAYFFITRHGSLNNLWIVRLDPDHLPAALDSLDRTPRCDPMLWVQAQGRRRAWSFTEWRPLLARMWLDRREFLLACPDASTAVILAHVGGRLQAAVQLGMRELADFDAGSWLAMAPPWPGRRGTPRPNSSPPSTRTEAAAPSLTQSEREAAEAAPKCPQPTRSPPRTHENVTASESEADVPPLTGAARRREPEPVPSAGDTVRESAVQPVRLPAGGAVTTGAARTASSPPKPPARAEPPTSPEPASSPPKQVTPRFPLAAGASADELQRHFLDVEAAIPPRKTGAATAVEIWQGIREAHQQGVLPITGNWVDLVAFLHHRGLLAHLPSDRASRAALLILAELSPLVRRLHRRRWVLGVER